MKCIGKFMGRSLGARLIRYAMLCSVVIAANGCAMLPDSGPSRRDVESDATVAMTGTTGTVGGAILNYALVDLNRYVLPFVYDPGPGSLYRSFGTGRGPVPEIKVGVGDTIAVTLFEAQAGGLLVPTEAGSRPGNFVTLPNQTVDSKGYISIPYAGQIYALNRSTPDIQREIVDKLQQRAIQPQAIVSIIAQTSTSVTVLGDGVGGGAKIPINPAGDRVLDVIARVGGIHNPGYEEYVTLLRRGVKATVYFLNVVKDPHENVFVQPGDTLYVYSYQRAFTAFGATGQSSQFKFQQENLTLNDAVGKAGGLQDVRADPGQVFVYRIEHRSTLERIGADISHFRPDEAEISTIYRVNFRDPSGFFAARRFPMRDNDVIYVDNADQVEVTKFINLITTLQTPANQALTTWSSAKFLLHCGNGTGC
jgi:polysaccharide export outer membrane protein